MSGKLPRLTSVTRWLQVVVGCAILEMAQPTNAAEPVAPVNGPVSAGQIIYPKDAPERPAPPSTTEPDGLGRPVATLLVLLLLGAGVWVFVQRRSGGVAGGARGRKLQVEETRPLGNRQYLVVASYEGQKFLLGVTPGQIQLLSPLDGGRGTGNP